MVRRIVRGAAATVIVACFGAGCASLTEMRTASMEAQFKPACGGQADTPQYAQCVQEQIREMGPE